MRLLGQVRSTDFILYADTNLGPIGSFATWPWFFELAGASYRGADCPQPTNIPTCLSATSLPVTLTDGYKNLFEPQAPFNQAYVFATAFPWTTGVAFVSVLRNHTRIVSAFAFPTIIQRTGFDNRTSMGAGTIQLVTPHLVNWAAAFQQRTTGAIAILRLQLVPEPASWLLLAAGGLFLAVLYRRRTR